MASPGDTLAAAMPPGAWIESQRRFRLTAAGKAALSQPDDGTPRRQVLARLATGPKTLRGRADAALASLEREGLIERVTALSGRARAFRTSVTAVLTPAGISAALPSALRRIRRWVPGNAPRSRRSLAATNPRPSAALREAGVERARCEGSRRVATCTCTSR